MKTLKWLLCVLLLTTGLPRGSANGQTTGQTTGPDVEKRINALIAQMTVEEKLG
jgi:hypothetical protein